MSITRSQIARQLMAEGGAPRQGYFLGKIVKKFREDIIPNELKSPLGAAATLGGLYYLGRDTQLPTDKLDDRAPNMLDKILGGVKRIGGGIKKAVTSDTAKDIVFGQKKSETETNPDQRSGGILGALLSPTGLSLGAGLLAGALTKDEDDPLYTGQSVGLNLRDIRKLANITDPRTGSAI